MSFGEAVRANRLEMTYAMGLALVAAVSLASILPVVFVILPTLFSPYLALVHNHKKARLGAAARNGAHFERRPGVTPPGATVAVPSDAGASRVLEPTLR